jgi:hypothetical protein
VRQIDVTPEQPTELFSAKPGEGKGGDDRCPADPSTTNTTSSSIAMTMDSAQGRFELTTAFAGTGAQRRQPGVRRKERICRELGVDDRIRTGDRLDHNQELYQLSYIHRVASI